MHIRIVSYSYFDAVVVAAASYKYNKIGIKLKRKVFSLHHWSVVETLDRFLRMDASTIIGSSSLSTVGCVLSMCR